MNNDFYMLCDNGVFKLPEDLLAYLKCYRCDRYLNVTPVMVNGDENQICGKCWNLLPSYEKTGCVRQVGYEALVSRLFTFPCQYNVQGCDVEFKINEADCHELTCPFRPIENDFGDETGCLIMPGDDSRNGEENGLKKEEICVRFLRKHKMYENGHVKEETNRRNSEEFVRRVPSIEGRLLLGSTYGTLSESYVYAPSKGASASTPKYKGHKVRLSIYDDRDEANNETAKGPTLSCENLGKFQPTRVVSRSSTPGSLNRLEGGEEAIYETIASGGSRISLKMKTTASTSTLYRRQPKCSSCANILKGEIFHCTFGHDICKMCKKLTECRLCASPINSTPRYYCKNYLKGCRVYLPSLDQNDHSKICEFREFACLLPDRCKHVCNTFKHLETHTKDFHSDSIVLLNRVERQSSGRSDEMWIMSTFDNLFVCKRFSFEEDVEFLVELAGTRAEVRPENFKYEVCVMSAGDDKQASLTRSATCLGRCSSALDRALVITRVELKARKIEKFNFAYSLEVVKR